MHQPTPQNAEPQHSVRDSRTPRPRPCRRRLCAPGPDWRHEALEAHRDQDLAGAESARQDRNIAAGATGLEALLEPRQREQAGPAPVSPIMQGVSAFVARRRAYLLSFYMADASLLPVEK